MRTQVAEQAMPNPLRVKGKAPTPKDLSEFICDPFLISVALLLTEAKPEPRLSAIARQLGCTVSEANEALEHLLDCGLIIRRAEGYEQCASIKSGDLSNLGSDVAFTSHVNLSNFITAQLSDFERSYFHSSILALDKERVRSFTNDLNALFATYRSQKPITADVQLLGITVGASLLNSGKAQP